MSKPGKISIETKKDTCYYEIGAYSKVRVGSYGTRFVVDWGGRQRQGRQRQRRQAKTEKARKTEKAGKDREGKKDRRVCSKIFISYNGRRAVTVQGISQKYIKPAFWIVTLPVSVQPC